MDRLTGLARQLTRLDETTTPTGYAHRFEGVDWPATAETMIGVARLLNLADCLKRAVGDGVSGGFAECGVWRGGACIMAAATLDELGEQGRPVWVCDSFQGVPEPSYTEDDGSTLHLNTVLNVPASEVRANFERYGLLTERVRFVEGWFADTLPGPVGDLCVLRCDGDLYESTWQTLTALYDHVRPGGFVIVDDYGVWRGCKAAVDQFREQRGIDVPVQEIGDGCGAVFWRVGGGPAFEWTVTPMKGAIAVGDFDHLEGHDPAGEEEALAKPVKAEKPAAPELASEPPKPVAPSGDKK